MQRRSSQNQFVPRVTLANLGCALVLVAVGFAIVSNSAATRTWRALGCVAILAGVVETVAVL